MPELPEVETLASQLRREISGLVFTKVQIRCPSILGSPRPFFEQKIPGRKILSVERRGKFLSLKLDQELTLWFHLGMTGQLLLRPGIPLNDPHTHVILQFTGRPVNLIFRDIRKFGQVTLTNGDPEKFPEGIRLLGPEPFHMNAEEFTKLFKKRTGRIKSLLLNQRILAGIGNIYADESLFRAGIDPRRRPHRLPRERLAKLHESICTTLKEAIAHGGSSIDDYIHTNGSSGRFQNYHRVYGKWKKQCGQCGALIRRIRLAGRSSFFCSECQK